MPVDPLSACYRRAALLLLSLFLFALPCHGSPLRPPRVLVNPLDPTPTPKVVPPPRPLIRRYGDFSRRRIKPAAQFVARGWNDELSNSPYDMGFGLEHGAASGRVVGPAVELEKRALAKFARTTTTTATRKTTTTTKKTTTTTKPASTTTTRPVTTTSPKSSSTSVPAPSSTTSSSPGSTSSPAPSSSTTSSPSSSTTTTQATSSSTTSTSIAPSATPALPCVDSSANASYISSLFAYGGVGYTVALCPNANIALTDAIFMWFANQTLTTLGNPTDSTRAVLTIANPNISCAIYAAVDFTNYLSIQNIQIDGARPALGIMYGGLALIEMGGNTIGQRVSNIKAFEPRGWSVLHIIEGYNGYCDGAQILNNEIGPSGHAPSGVQQFRKKRDSTGTYTPGQWADGISLACRNSLVQGNTVRDTTDGGIVIFGAPGSLVTGNTIIADDRQALGGINMVDWAPFGGTFEGTVVSNNNIIAQNSLLKLGIAVGGLTWGVDNRTIARTFGGRVENNVFSSGPTGYFGYSIAVAGHENATIVGNSADSTARYSGAESPSCFTYWFPLPVPQPFIADPWTTPGVVMQSDFQVNTTVVLPVCRGPNP